MFDSPTYYLLMSLFGWLLVGVQIIIVVWLYRNLREKK